MAPESFNNPESSSEPSSDSSEEKRRLRSMRKWILVGVAAVFFGYLFYIVVNPYRGQRFEEVPHGDHVHYVPKDRNPDVPIGQFPTQKPGPGERITPDGQVVPANR